MLCQIFIYTHRWNLSMVNQSRQSNTARSNLTNQLHMVAASRVWLCGRGCTCSSCARRCVDQRVTRVTTCLVMRIESGRCFVASIAHGTFEGFLTGKNTMVAFVTVYQTNLACCCIEPVINFWLCFIDPDLLYCFGLLLNRFLSTLLDGMANLVSKPTVCPNRKITIFYLLNGMLWLPDVVTVGIVVTSSAILVSDEIDSLLMLISSSSPKSVA